MKLELAAKVSRIMVNQVQAFGNGGFFNLIIPPNMHEFLNSWKQH